VPEQPGNRSGLTYDTPGMTAGLRQAPPGFRLLRIETTLPPGTYQHAVDTLFDWRMHDATPFLQVLAADGPASQGVHVLLRLGSLRAPCEVVHAARGPDEARFSYNTLSGHPECGEESFTLRRRPDDSATFTVLALSRPTAPWLRLAGPVGSSAQSLIARGYGRTLRWLSRSCPL
jgi:uncharacterized protein (UPF0548 family)